MTECKTNDFYISYSMSNNTENIDKKLTAKEEKFCYEYVLYLNATKAAVNAGYSERTARQSASRLLSNVNIQNRISEMQADLAKTSEISALRVIKEHEKIAFSSIAHLHNTWIERVDFEKLSEEQKTCIKNITSRIQTKDIGTTEKPEIINIEFIKIELYDKQKSLDSINKMLGYEAAVKTEVTGKDGKDLIPDFDISKLSDEERKLLLGIAEKANANRE